MPSQISAPEAMKQRPADMVGDNGTGPVERQIPQETYSVEKRHQPEESPGREPRRAAPGIYSKNSSSSLCSGPAASISSSQS